MNDAKITLSVRFSHNEFDLVFCLSAGIRRSRELHVAQEPQTLHNPTGQGEHLPHHFCLLHQIRKKKFWYDKGLIVK